MIRIKKSYRTFLICIGILSCNVMYNNAIFSFFDSENRNITIVSGSDPLIVGIKEIFIQNDWQVLTFSKDIVQSEIDFSSIDTNYIMLSSYNQGKDLFLGPFVQEYEFTIYDTTSEIEVAVLYGSQRTVDQVVDEFKYILENNYE